MKSLASRLLMTSVGAVIASLAYPQPGIGLLMFVGLPLMVFAFRGQTLRRGALIGFVTGFVYYGAVAKWLTIYLGVLPWLGLVGLQAVIFTGGGVLLAAAWKAADALNLHSLRGVVSAGFILSAAWVTREVIASQWPWGGFAWARVSQSQADTPLRYLTTLLGTTGASAAIVFVVVVAVVFWQTTPRGKLLYRRLLVLTGSLLALLPMPYLLLTTAANGSIRVAAVQGNSDSALFSSARRGDAIQKHYDAMSAVTIGEVDAVIWPENAMDINPLDEPRIKAFVESVSRDANAPFIFGTITSDGDETFNSVLQWEAGKGVVDQYDKVHPVPFAEYLPERDFFYPLAPSLFDMVPRDYSKGTRDPVFTVGDAVAGIAICFDIVNDGLFRSILAHDANVIFAPTNNSDFGETDESIQQLGIARMRAVETGRAVVNISTVGVSAIIAPDGSDIRRLTPFEPGVMIADVPLSTVTTPASVIGFPLEIALIFAGLVPLGLPVVKRLRARD